MEKRRCAASQSGIIIHRVWRPSWGENILRKIYMRMEWIRLEKKTRIYGRLVSVRMFVVYLAAASVFIWTIADEKKKTQTSNKPTYVIVSTCELFAIPFWILMSLKKKCHGFALLVKSYSCSARAADGSNNGRDKVFRKFHMKVSLNISAANHARFKLCCAQGTVFS